MSTFGLNIFQKSQLKIISVCIWVNLRSQSLTPHPINSSHPRHLVISTFNIPCHSGKYTNYFLSQILYQDLNLSPHWIFLTPPNVLAILASTEKTFCKLQKETYLLSGTNFHTTKIITSIYKMRCPLLHGSF